MVTNARRIQSCRLDERMLGLLLCEGAKVRCMSGVPADAVCVGMDFDFSTRSILVAFEHPSFEPMPMGYAIPSMLIAFEIIEHPWRDAGMHVPTEMGIGPLGAN